LTQIEIADTFHLDSRTCRCEHVSFTGDPLNTSGSNSSAPPDLHTPGAEQDFQRLLLGIAAHTGDGLGTDSLIQFFCHSTREFFRVSGVYFWRSPSEDELVGEYADAKFADRFVGLQLPPGSNAVTAEAVRCRRTIFLNQVRSAPFPETKEFGARSVLAAPLMVRSEVIGAVTFVHESDENFFNEELAAKATTLASRLSGRLEAAGSSDTPKEQNRKAVADAVQSLHGPPDVSSVIEALADRLRLLLRTRLVCVLLRREGPFELRAVSAETSQLADSVRARHDRQMIRFAADLAQRAVSAGEPITLALSADAHSLGSLVSPGMLVAAPFRTARTQGAILVYPRAQGIFTAEEKSLVAALAGFGAVAVAHAEQYGAAQAQAHELHELLEISSALISTRGLEQFFQEFVLRAGDFLGFRRCFIAPYDEGNFYVRCVVEKSEPRHVDEIFPEGPVARNLRAKEVFSTDDAGNTSSSISSLDLHVVTKFPVQQLLAVPLLDASGNLLGMFGLLDRFDGKSISPEDIRRARVLASYSGIALAAAQHQHGSEQHRRRSQAMMELEVEVDGFQPLPDFARRFLLRACDLTGFKSGALAIFQDGRLHVAAVHSAQNSSTDTSIVPVSEETNSSPLNGHALVSAQIPILAIVPETDFVNGELATPPIQSPSSGRSPEELDRMLVAALNDFTVQHGESLLSGVAADLLNPAVADALGWEECTIVRLQGAGKGTGKESRGGRNKDLSGLMVLSGRATRLQPEDRVFLEALAANAATALNNLRLFFRMEQANRQWLEIFDAMSDFVVVHDEADSVLRVNRSLAAMIGVAPAELIGVNMRALLAVGSDVTSYSCPFCRSMADDTDEFVHPLLDRTYLVSTSRVQNASSGGLQIIHVLKDISDRREAERRYRELFDNIQEGLFFSTPAGRFIEVNEALVHMLGYASRDELLQIDIPSQLYFSPDQRMEHAAAMDESGHLRNFEATLRRKNGSPVHVLINAFGHYDSSGALIQIRGLMLDVTGLRTYQSELHRERDFSAKILNNTQGLILVADTAGLISYANRRWADSGFQQRDLLGRPILELAAPGFVRSLAEAVQNTLSGQQVNNLEVQVLRGNGVIGQFSANLSPMRDEQETVTSIVVILTDITDSVMLRDKLIHAEKMAAVGQLVSGVAHEVNNPLTAILGFADLLMENTELPESARKDLRVILQEAQRTKQIVQNLLSFARQMPAQRNALQLNAILGRTIQLRSYDFNSHGVEVIEHLDERLPEVIGDAQQLQQVFLNILNNAYDAVHEIGRPARIEIMTAKSATAVEVSFRDNGQGITNPDRIFDPFFTTKEIGKGTGLGLSICYGIVKEHGGEILCHNNSDGQGATFVVRLPAVARPVSVGMAAGELQT
jgi:PAS domain S-box-containing protein